MRKDDSLKHVKSVHWMDHFYVYYLLLEFITYNAVIQFCTIKKWTVKLVFILKMKPISLTRFTFIKTHYLNTVFTLVKIKFYNRHFHRNKWL